MRASTGYYALSAAFMAISALAFWAIGWEAVGPNLNFGCVFMAIANLYRVLGR